MSTTALAVELLIIGYQTLFWVGLATCLFLECDKSILQDLKDWQELLIIGSIVAAYTSGAIMNGVASRLMSWITGKRIYEGQIPSEMRAAILAQKPEAYVEVMKNFDTPRVLRSTIFNFLLTGLFTAIHLCHSTPLTPSKLLLVFLPFILAGFAAWAWYETDENYFTHLSKTFDEVEKNK